jgi:hypothetical protein
VKTIHVEEYGSDELEWSYHSRIPKFRAGSLTFNADPFPGYAHNKGVVEQTAKLCYAAVKNHIPVYVHLPAFDQDGGTNGFTHLDQDYDNERKKWVPKENHIVLLGKRTPLHPAMSRFIMAHEYGHAVEDWMIALWDYDQHNDDFLEYYRDKRGLSPFQALRGTGPNEWWRAVAEIFADDFRILCTGIEEEHWPHGTVPRPEYVNGLSTWWDDAMAELNQAAS